MKPDNKTTDLGKHYSGGVECIDAMETVVKSWADAGMPEAGLCFAQTIKYLMRPGKGQVAEDLEKAQDYFTRGTIRATTGVGAWKKPERIGFRQRLMEEREGQPQGTPTDG